MINIHQIIADNSHASTELLLSSLTSENRGEADTLESIVCRVLLSHSSNLLEKYHEALRAELSQQGIDI